MSVCVCVCVCVCVWWCAHECARFVTNQDIDLYNEHRYDTGITR